MPAVVVAGGLAAAGAIGGAAIGASATKKAAKNAAQAQLQATEMNNALAREQYGKNEAQLSPFIQRGNQAGNTLNALLGLGGDAAAANNAFRQFIDNSDYAFQENQGERGLGARLSAAGGVESGAGQKALQQYRTNLQNGFRTNYMGLLGGQQGAGLSGASALAGVSNAYVNNVTNNNQNAADAQSNAALIRGNANANLYSTIGNAFGNLAGSIVSGGGFGGSFKMPTYNTPPYGGNFGYTGRPTQYGSFI